MNFKDNVWTGLISGITAPMIAFAVYTKIKFPHETIMAVMQSISSLGIVSATISLSVFVNLLVFFIFIWNKADRSAKGVLGATFIYAFIVVILKLT